MGAETDADAAAERVQTAEMDAETRRRVAAGGLRGEGEWRR